ncbi:MAG TPA: hypothetical protein VMN56_14430 [Casimicrobiaceae bacterium]|nr:hypothetical protein [Casimicrobiaceae bacterium]
MAASRRIAVVLAGLVAAPGVLLAVAACLYIAYSLVTESWYRRWFLDYGLMLAVLYVAFVAGVVALARLATGSGERRPRLAIGVTVVGFAAACALEFELWDEAERVLPFGLLFGPYLAWVAAWLWIRKLPPPPPPPPQWEDTKV